MRSGDGQIISQCLNGNPAIFGVLVDKYKEGIYALVYSKLGNFHDAQDITQETFIKAYQKLHTLRQHESFSVWLCAIASNLCKDFVRSRSARPDREYLEEQSPNFIDHLSIDSRKADSMSESLRDALESLPEVYRQVLMLHYFSGMNRIDIAMLLGVSLRTVGERLRIARERLREEMIAMIGAAVKDQKLPAGFTFRIVELVKRIKIQPVSTMQGLPWGLSLATGIIIAVMSINPTLVRIDNFGTPIFAPLPSETKVLKSGEIPVDTVRISDLPILSSMIGKGNGGKLKPDVQNSFFMAPQGEGGEWTKRADMPTARMYISASVVDGKIYVIGGRENAAVVLPTIEEYDPGIDKWSQKADMHTERIDFPTVTLKGKIYAMGGIRIRNGSPLAIKEVEEYDPKMDKWVRKADMPIARAEFSAVAVNGKIYAIGGWTPDRPLQTVDEYDPTTDTWTKRADMPTAREGAVAGVVNGNIYVAGGFDRLGNTALSTLEEYDPEADTWSKKADMPFACYFANAVTINEKIHVMGGWRPDRAAIPGVVDNTGLAPDVNIYDPATDTWIDGVDMPAPRIMFAVGAVNKKIYAFGGARGICITWQPCPGNTPPLPLVEEFTPGDWHIVSPQNKLTTTWGEVKGK